MRMIRARRMGIQSTAAVAASSGIARGRRIARRCPRRSGLRHSLRFLRHRRQPLSTTQRFPRDRRRQIRRHRPRRPSASRFRYARTVCRYLLQASRRRRACHLARTRHPLRVLDLPRSHFAVTGATRVLGMVLCRLRPFLRPPRRSTHLIRLRADHYRQPPRCSCCRRLPRVPRP